MDIQCAFERDLAPQAAQEILDLQHKAFPNTAEFARQRWWHSRSSPDEVWVLLTIDGRLAASTRVVRRQVAAGGQTLDVGGIGNVCSDPDRRGQGLARAVMLKAQEWIAQNADFGVLFCGQALAEYYRKLGWQDIDNPIEYIDTDNKRKRAGSAGHGHVMICPGRKAVASWPAGVLDLNGHDW